MTFNKYILCVLYCQLLILFNGCLPKDHRQFLENDTLTINQIATDRSNHLNEFQPQAIESNVPEFPVKGQLDLSVEQAALFVLKYNSNVHIRQMNPIITGTFEKIERGIFTPEWFAELKYSENKYSEISENYDPSMVDQQTFDAAAGIQQALPTGTDIAASVEQNKSISNQAPKEQTTRLGLSITQSLLRGFGPAVNLVSVHQAKLDIAASHFELRGYLESLLADTEIAYWDFVLAVEKITIFEHSLEVARQQLNEIKQRILVGMLPKIESAAAQVEVARREQALIDARSNLKSNQLKLMRLIAPSKEASFDIQIKPVSNPRTEAKPISDLTDRLSLAYQSRSDLNEARLRLKHHRLETIKTRNGLLPKLDVFVALGKTGYGETFSESYRSLDHDTYDFTVGFRVNHFLTNQTAQAKNIAAQTSHQQALKAVDNLRQLVEFDVRLAANEVERARLQIAASHTTRLLQEKTLKAEKERFDVGSSTALLVAQAQRDSLETYVAEVEAIVGYRKSLVNLFLSEGSLLERRGIDFKSLILK
ncbi:MAG: TolC family protein [Candidatus Magnetomorum sp.]|nr:TolC family protein [Candidatus Magnetomorum sp.]